MGKTKNKKKNKKQQRHSRSSKGGFSAFIIVVLVIIVLIFAYKSNQKNEKIHMEIDNLITMFQESISSSTSSDIVLFDTNSEYVRIQFSSNNEWYLSSTGKVTLPTVLEGNKKVRLTMNIKVINTNFFDDIVYKLLNKPFLTNYSQDIIILCRELTDKEKVDYYYDSLVLPQKINTSIGLPVSFSRFSGVNVSWESTDENILTSQGNKVNIGDVTLKATITSGEETRVKEFNCSVCDKITLQAYSCDFSSFKKSSYADLINHEGLILKNCINDGETLKFKIEQDLASIRTDSIVLNCSKVTFNYRYNEEANFEKDTFITLYESIDGTSWQEVKKDTLKTSGNKTFTHQYDVAKNCYLKIVITSNYADGSKYIILDDFMIEKEISASDITTSLDKQLPNMVKENVDLPTTTIYGGIITYSTDSSNFSSNGIITKINEAQEIVLSATITGFGFPCFLNKTIKIAGLLEVTPVEIRFVDVGKYGHKDCGESIYIKYGDIDVLIDAGDNYDSTVQAVEEVIDEYSNDKVLDYVIATHPDADHIGSMDNIISDYEVKYIVQFSNDYTSKVYNKYQEAVTEEQCTTCTALDSYNNSNGCTRIIELGEDVFIEFYNTTFYQSEENNSRSVVCILNAYGVRTLFTGDADNAKYDIEDAYKDEIGNIDILKVVHHGTANGTTMDFLKAVDPEVAIICNGNYFGNQHGHPTYEAIKNLYDYDSNILVYAVVGGDVDDCTLTTKYECEPTDYLKDRNGIITIIINDNGYNISSEYYADAPIEVKDTEFWQARSALAK